MHYVLLKINLLEGMMSKLTTFEKTEAFETSQHGQMWLLIGTAVLLFISLLTLIFMG